MYIVFDICFIAEKDTGNVNFIYLNIVINLILLIIIINVCVYVFVFMCEREREKLCECVFREKLNYIL